MLRVPAILPVVGFMEVTPNRCVNKLLLYWYWAFPSTEKLRETGCTPALAGPTWQVIEVSETQINNLNRSSLKWCIEEKFTKKLKLCHDLPIYS